MKRLLFFVTFMGLGTVLLLLVLVSEPVRMQPAAEGPRETPDVMVMNTVAVRQMDARRLRWELWAEEAHVRDDGRSASLTAVRFRLYDDDGRTPLLWGRSGRARVTDDPTRLELEQGVVLQRGDALRITTERLEFDQERNVLRAPAEVRIESREGVQEGDSLEYSLGEETLRFTRPRFAQ